ncbi:cytochrome c biogenesis CcdA family protein [Halovivax gelatinilyticus]|uniref:cytochrome c biogenesis CcdA family protein n=1 Tax=Halovivax gelatinilyticus TaxID=2961597 RepID=UPI0020CA5019|nr:cytochrome c biogenesis protein CcdA [Halovivax gelatinilyticus]
MPAGEVLSEIVFALGAGIATFFAPCSYALLPGYVGYYVAATGRDAAPLRGALARGSAAAVGSLGTFAALSGVAIVAGSALERTLPYLELGVGGALIVLGLWIAYGGSSAVHVMLPRRRASIVGFGVFGAMYALAATACVLPLFLAFVFQTLTMPAAETTLVLGTYAASFAVMLLAVTVAVAVGHRLSTERFVGLSERLVRIAGVVLVLAGLGQIYVAL